MRYSNAALAMALLVSGCSAPSEIEVASAAQEITWIEVEPSPIARPILVPTPPPPPRPPSEPTFPPGINGSHHVPPDYDLWWAAAEDPDGDALRYQVRTRVGDGPLRTACVALIVPPCRIQVPAGARVEAIVGVTDGIHQRNSTPVTVAGRLPVVLLPDLDGNVDVFDALADRLRRDGFHVLVKQSFKRLTPEPDTTLLDLAVTNVSDSIMLALAAEGFRAGTRVDVIALGGGGLAARVLAEERGVVENSTWVDPAWNEQIENVILVGTPSMGADLGCAWRVCADAQPGSKLLGTLARDDPPPDTLVVSLDADPRIPADAMRIHRAPDVRIEGASRTSAIDRDEVYRAILAQLATRRG